MGELGRVLGLTHGAHSSFTSLAAAASGVHDPASGTPPSSAARATGRATFGAIGLPIDPVSETTWELWVEQPGPRSLDALRDRRLTRYRHRRGARYVALRDLSSDRGTTLPDRSGAHPCRPVLGCVTRSRRSLPAEVPRRAVERMVRGRRRAELDR